MAGTQALSILLEKYRSGGGGGPQSRKKHFWRFHCQSTISAVPRLFYHLGNRSSVFCLFVLFLFLQDKCCPSPWPHFPLGLAADVSLWQSHVNHTGTPKWNALEGTTVGKGKVFVFSSFLCVKMWIQELALKHPLSRDEQAMGREFAEDTEELGS